MLAIYSRPAQLSRVECPSPAALPEIDHRPSLENLQEPPAPIDAGGAGAAKTSWRRRDTSHHRTHELIRISPVWVLSSDRYSAGENYSRRIQDLVRRRASAEAAVR